MRKAYKIYFSTESPFFLHISSYIKHFLHGMYLHHIQAYRSEGCKSYKQEIAVGCKWKEIGKEACCVIKPFLGGQHTHVLTQDRKLRTDQSTDTTEAQTLWTISYTELHWGYIQSVGERFLIAAEMSQKSCTVKTYPRMGDSS